ncbi:mannose-6-phosphate isomerase-like isoform X2 [Hylaeus volcanicus]|nr:mannose-6-phosphate isomerase-like isoform X2 [Hylaeus volcanicus]
MNLNQAHIVSCDLTFIMKILSIRKPLSLQCHPDKHNATKLHEKYPLLYPDANHKPEMGIVISNEAQILCGFRPYEEFLKILNNITPLYSFYNTLCCDISETSYLLSSVNCTKERNLYQSILTKTLNATSMEITTLFNQIEEFSTRHKSNAELPFVVTSSLKLFESLKNEFVQDNACLCCFFLNHFHLKTGDAIYIPVNVLHTYLIGDIIECMAASDNVIRCGLSNKAKDLRSLFKLVDYTVPVTFSCVPEDCGETYIAEDDLKFSHLYIYRTPVSDFQVVLGVLSASCFTKKPLDDLICYPCIILVLYGTLMVTTESASNTNMRNNGTVLKQGQSVVLQATDSYYYHNPQHSSPFYHKKPIQFLGVSMFCSTQLFEDHTIFVISSSRK